MSDQNSWPHNRHAIDAAFLSGTLQNIGGALIYHERNTDINLPKFLLHKNPHFNTVQGIMFTPLLEQPTNNSTLPTYVSNVISIVSLKRAIHLRNKEEVNNLPDPSKLIASMLVQHLDRQLDSTMNILSDFMALTNLFTDHDNPTNEWDAIQQIPDSKGLITDKEYHIFMLHRDNLFSTTLYGANTNTIYAPNISEMRVCVDTHSNHNGGLIKINDINTMIESSKQIDFTIQRNSSKILYSACHRFVCDGDSSEKTSTYYITEFQSWNEKRECTLFGFNIYIRDLIITVFQDVTEPKNVFSCSFDPYKLATNIELISKKIDRISNVKFMYDPYITSNVIDGDRSSIFRQKYNSYLSNIRNDVGYTSACVSFYYKQVDQLTADLPNVVHVFSKEHELFHKYPKVTKPAQKVIVIEQPTKKTDLFTYREIQLSAKSDSTRQFPYSENDSEYAKRIYEEQQEEERLYRIAQEEKQRQIEEDEKFARTLSYGNDYTNVLDDGNTPMYSTTSHDNNMLDYTPNYNNSNLVGNDRESSWSRSSSSSPEQTTERSPLFFDSTFAPEEDASVDRSIYEGCSSNELKTVIAGLNYLWKTKEENGGKQSGSNIVYKELTRLSNLISYTENNNLWGDLYRIRDILSTIDLSTSYNNNTWNNVTLKSLGKDDSISLKENLQELKNMIKKAKTGIREVRAKYETEEQICEEAFINQFSAILTYFLLTPINIE